MIKQRLQILSDELGTEFVFSVDEDGNMVDLTIAEKLEGVSIPRFTLLVDDNDPNERYVLSVLESPLTVYFGSNICETMNVFVSNDIEEIFRVMKEESLKENGSC